MDKPETKEYQSMRASLEAKEILPDPGEDLSVLVDDRVL
jgi:hypothetical protein